MVSITIASSLAMLIGCERSAPSADTAGAPATRSPETAAPSPWRTGDGDAPLIALPADEPDEALEAAAAEARLAALGARERWSLLGEGSRRGWFIKWAAPTEDGGREYLWVEPLHWSEFRIEGRIASEPQRALAWSRARGDTVGFPAEELVDWIAPGPGELGTPKRGGFTVKELEARYGTPPEG